MGFLTLPGPRYRLVNARAPVSLAPSLAGEAHAIVPCELAVADGHIVALGPPGAAPADLPAVDLAGGLVLPRFVDVHTHLDKGHIAPRSPNPDGTFFGARAAVMADREARWSAADVAARMDFALRCAFHHGTGAIRSHIDSVGAQTAISWPVFAEMREAWKGRIALQAVALFPVDIAADDAPQFRAIVETVARHGGVLGGVTFLDEPPGPKLELALDRIFAAARAHGLDLDFHVDESNSPDARTLERIALAARRHGFAGRILAGHCCSLALADDAEHARVVERTGEAGIAVVSLPMCNMYLQDRAAGRTPRWRGVAPLHELDAAGVDVMVASDNTRDPFYAYGDLDMLEVWREALRILHLDHSDRPWLRLLGATAADLMGLPQHGRLQPGGPADLVLTRARDAHELAARPQADRVVVVAGAAIDTTLPDYRELDPLHEAPACPPTTSTA
ncbi:MAG: cytosine deaminase [Xanthobacteraceae bacterium]|nr:cytosine deaminase [Xanthobacteraceae bacterium]